VCTERAVRRRKGRDTVHPLINSRKMEGNGSIVEGVEKGKELGTIVS